jgi:SpoVK/Ycf46/Vps4 family AAA+-type ATPase
MSDRSAAFGALAPHLELVRLRAEVAIMRRLNAGYGFADSRMPSELFLRNADARERLSRDQIRPQDTHEAQEEEVTKAIERLRTQLATHESRLATVCDRFHLNATERELLATVVGYELDPDVRDLCHALAPKRKRALYADVCQDLGSAMDSIPELLHALHPNGALRGGCLVEMTREAGGDARRAKLSDGIGATRQVLDWLLGDERVSASMHGIVEVTPPDVELGVYLSEAVTSQIERVAELLSQSTDEPAAVVLLQGPEGAGKRAVALALARAQKRSLAAVALHDLQDLAKETGDRDLLQRALAEARMRDALPYLPGMEALTPGEGGDPDRRAIDAIDQHKTALVLASRDVGMPSLPFSRAFHVIRIPPSPLEARTIAWRYSLSAIDEGDRISPDESDQLAARYVIGPGAIAEVVRDADAFTKAKGTRLGIDEVEQAVGRRLTLKLGSFGSRITRRSRFEEMVLPEDVVETLRDMVAMVRQRAQILERWGYGRHLGLSRGVSALFSGEPGTGKTMAASVLSSELGLELFRIDLSSVVSKWVGETEKHLSKIFDEAQDAQAMLLFDEADSLFGKRTDVKSSSDRYANLEVNYILQRMESFDGVSILTTNMESGIDQAFMRRINFRVRFPEPDVDERMKLWGVLVPPETGLPTSVDFTELAERFEMTGGHIRNAIVRAAVIAAREEREMTVDDLVAGAHLEYFELGKVMHNSLV